jgi:hypothetical protein
MADNSGGAGYPDDDAHLDLKPLMRLAAWGAGACAALAVAVMAAQSDMGGRRAGTAIASLTGAAGEQSQKGNRAELLARAEAEREAKRLAEAVRVLAGDRDRLAGRVAHLERNLEDLTGSVARVAAQPHPPAVASRTVEPPPVATAPKTAPAAPTPVTPPPPNAAEPPATWAPQPAIPMPPEMAAVTPLWREHAELPVIPPKNPPKEVLAKENPAKEIPAKEIPAKEPSADTETTPLPRPGPVAVLQSYAGAGSSSAASAHGPTPSVGVHAPVPPASADGPAAPRLDYAIDLGAAPNLAGLRALWERVRIRQPASLDGLHPLVSVRDGAKPGTAELRLVAGPLADTTAVARVCASLLSVGIACQPAVFDGQRLPAAEASRPRPAAPAPPATRAPGRPPV